MSIHEFIISIYLIIDEFYSIIVTRPLRTRGFAPALSDVEIITMQIVGEFLELDYDKSIWMVFRYLFVVMPEQRGIKTSVLPSKKNIMDSKGISPLIFQE